MPRSRLPEDPNLFSQSNIKKSLLLQDTNDKNVELKAAQLEQWFAAAELSLIPEPTLALADTNVPKLANKILNFFGFQTSQDVIEYLKSPAGKITTALIQKELAEEETMDRRVMQNVLLKRHQYLRRLSFLLLGLLHKREAHAQMLNEETQQANDKRRQTMEQPAKQRRTTTPSPTDYTYLYRTFAAYTEATDALEITLGKKFIECSLIENALAHIELTIKFVAKKYTQYNDQLDAAYSDIDQWTLNVPIATVEQKIQLLTTKLALDTAEISKLLDAGDDEAARDMMELSNARNLYISTLLDMLSVIDGRKFMYTEFGERTLNFREAHFIIAQQKKILHKNGKYYLLESSQDSESLSEEDKATGEKAYLRLRPDIMGVRQLIQHNQGLEQKEHHEKKTVLLARSEMMQQEILLLTNQLTQIQAARVGIEGTLAATPAPTMRPVLKPTSSARATSNCLSQSYQHMLLLMNSNPSERAIDWLKSNIANTRGTKKLQAQINTLTPGEPIPQPLMKQLLARKEFGRTWLNPNKPDIAQRDLTPYAASPIRTPFSTVPKPFRD